MIIEMYFPSISLHGNKKVTRVWGCSVQAIKKGKQAKELQFLKIKAKNHIVLTIPGFTKY